MLNKVFLFLFLFLFSFHVSSQCVAAFKFLVNGNSVDFVNSSTGSYSYELWEFGDGNINDVTSKPSHNYSQSGSYIVCLSIYDSNGYFCDSVCEKINIISSSIESFNDIVKLYPNPFAEFCKIYSESIIDCIYLYNSKGLLMQVIDDINSKDFKFSNKGLNSGVYNLKIITKNITLNKKIIVI